MKSTAHWVEEAVLREGAFELFASSSAGRYWRAARSLAEGCALKEHLESGLLGVSDLVQRARELRGYLACRQHREVEEVGLAIILSTLADTASEEVSDLLVSLSVFDKAPLAWMSALARKLYQDRALNIVAARPSVLPQHPFRILSSGQNLSEGHRFRNGQTRSQSARVGLFADEAELVR
jgi:hypothetical protein